jgi:hypothetical protein
LAGTAFSKVLPIPSSVCSNGGFKFYVVDYRTGEVIMIDSITGAQNILCGRPKATDFADGNADTGRFDPTGLALSVDEKTLYVCDMKNNRIRAIDTASGVMRTVAGSGSQNNASGIGTAASIDRPRFCNWDRASVVEPGTVLYITTHYGLCRLNINTGEMTTVNCGGLRPLDIVSLSGSGIIIITCFRTRCLWTIDPVTDTVERLAGTPTEVPGALIPTKSPTEWDDPLSIQFLCPVGLALHERDQSILVTDRRAHTVLRIPLPDRVFVKPPVAATGK